MTGNMVERGNAGRDQVVSIRWGPGTLVVTPKGPHLGERETGIIRQEADAAIENWSGPLKALVLDMSDVESMSSVALGVCIDLHNAADTLNAPVIIMALNPTLRELFRMVKVDRLFRIAEPGADLAA